MSRNNSRTTARISLPAIRHNLDVVRRLCPGAKISGVVKADGYGHGTLHVFKAIGEIVNSFAVATLDEAVSLRRLGFDGKIWVFSGILLDDEVSAFRENRLTPVVHNTHQLKLARSETYDLPIILKIDAGMGRLGFKPDDAEQILLALNSSDSDVMLMGHFSNADVKDSYVTNQELSSFLSVKGGQRCERSIAASAGILSKIGSNLSWVRPGLLLYGVSPFQDCIGQDHGLVPAMTLQSSLIAIRQFKVGDPIGYGGEWICPESMPVGIVGCGYGDGYPRMISRGSCVEVCGEKAPIIGRISMDSMAIDLRGIKKVQLGDSVVMWGQEIPIETVARHASTIPNELLARIPQRVNRIADWRSL